MLTKVQQVLTQELLHNKEEQTTMQIQQLQTYQEQIQTQQQLMNKLKKILW